jgi:hypothetical protein
VTLRASARGAARWGAPQALGAGGQAAKEGGSEGGGSRRGAVQRSRILRTAGGSWSVRDEEENMVWHLKEALL